MKPISINSHSRFSGADPVYCDQTQLLKYGRRKYVAELRPQMPDRR
jgi:hypothetical protein